MVPSLGVYYFVLIEVTLNLGWIGIRVKLNIGVVTIVGQCGGRRNIEDARKFTKSLIGFSSILFVITAVLLLPFFPLMMKLFQPFSLLF
jgi:Na+-driven multidrug efflux pump